MFLWQEQILLQYSDAKYSGSGYAADRIKIYFKGISSDDYTELTTEQINKYFQNAKGETGISVTTNSIWTFILKNNAPVGTYKNRSILYVSYGLY